jgi:hypothetical protein
MKMISHYDLENTLKDYFSVSSERIIIICPFISNSTLLSILPSDASDNVTIVTSWRPDHLRSGVSNIELYSLAESRGWTMYIDDHLHLKLYSNNLENAWMGSANLTDKALLDRQNDNIEGLVEIVNLDLKDQIFIESIISCSRLVTPEIYQLYRDWFEGIDVELPGDVEGPSLPSISTSDDFLITKLPAVWSPNQLWDLVTYSVEPDPEWGEEAAMIHDLALFRIPIEVSEEEFLESLNIAFFSQPFVNLFSEQVDEEGVQFGTAKEWIQNNCTTVPTPYRRELTATAQCLFNWYVELDPQKYELIQPNHSQILRLRKGLQSNKYCELTAHRLDRSWYVSEPSFPDSGTQYKSCPWCSQLHGSQLIFRIGRVYPDSDENKNRSGFGFTPQRRSLSNPDGIHAWCKPCRSSSKPTVLPPDGLTIEDLESLLDSNHFEISSRAFR